MAGSNEAVVIKIIIMVHLKPLSFVVTWLSEIR
jgi:hypothetical protein